VHIVGELTLDFRAYRRLALAPLSAWYGRFQAFLGFLAIVSIVLLAFGSFFPLSLAVGCAIGAVTFELAVLIGWRRTKKLPAEPHTDLTTRWDGITGVRTRPHYWALRLANKAVVAIPRAAFTADDVVHIDALVAAVGARSR
jgi:hypothetical protein